MVAIFFPRRWAMITTVAAECPRPNYLPLTRPRERARLTASSRRWTPSR
jgi:hypothetical protein